MLDDVLVVGAGPTGLLLAAELLLAGVRPVVLERRQRMGEVAKANALVGQVLQFLDYRGILERFVAASPADGYTASGYPFGNIYLQFAGLADPPLGMPLPQPELERLLDERVRELGGDVRRGHELVALRQDDAAVIAGVRGPDGDYWVSARFVVGCDGPRSRVRELAGIGFPGTTCREVHRLGQVTLRDPSLVLENGDLAVPGYGLLRSGFTPTERGVFAFAHRGTTPGALSVQTTEDDAGEIDNEVPLTLAELEASICRVLGADVALGEPMRLSRYQLHARQAERYRAGRVFVAGDAAHQFPATGIGLNVGMLDAVNLAWKLAAELHGTAPAKLLDSYHDERHYAGARAMLQTNAQHALRRGNDAASEALREVLRELLRDEQPTRRLGALVAGSDLRYALHDPDAHALTGTFVPDLALRTVAGTTSVAQLMHAGRPVYLDLANRADLRDIARGWGNRIDVVTAEIGRRPADAMLIRPDAHLAWVASREDTDASGLRDALTSWFGAAPQSATL